MELDEGRTVRALALAGLLAVLALPFAWNDLLPGGHRLRGLFESDTARAERATELHAFERILLFERENPSVPAGAIVFFGSSTVERFPLAECFPGKPAVDRGIDNARTDRLEQLQKRALGGLRPAGFVLYLGGVDVRHAEVNRDETLAHIETILRALESAYPRVPLLLLGLLPARRMDGDARQRLESLNAELERRTRAHGSTFLGTARAPLASSAGDLSEELSEDELHIDRAGYAVLAHWIATEGGPIGRLLAP